MAFAQPLYFLLLLPLVAIWLYRRRRIMSGALPLGNFEAARQSRKGYKYYINLLLPLLRYGAVIVLVAAAAKPQIPSGRVLTGKGVDIMIALDMSGSMNAVDKSFEEIYDLQQLDKEPSNRFNVARDVIKRFVLTRKGDRIGLVIFGAEAYLKFPLTLDRNRVITSLNTLVLDNGFRTSADGVCLNSCTIPGGSTAIGDALARAFMRIKNSKTKSKNIILITDGKSNSGTLDAVTVADYIATQPEDQRARVYTILVGSGKNTKVPRIDPHTGTFATNTMGHMVYETPNTPIPTDPELLAKIADLTGGKFFKSYNEENFQEIFNKLQKTEFKKKTTIIHNDIFDLFVLLALALIALERLLMWVVVRAFP